MLVGQKRQGLLDRTADREDGRRPNLSDDVKEVQGAETVITQLVPLLGATEQARLLL